MTVDSIDKLITTKILKASGFSFNLKLAPIMMFHLATALESLDYKATKEKYLKVGLVLKNDFNNPEACLNSRNSPFWNGGSLI